MREYEVTLEHIEAAITDGRLTLMQGLEAACDLHRTGLPEEFFEPLGVVRPERLPNSSPLANMVPREWYDRVVQDMLSRPLLAKVAPGTPMDKSVVFKVIRE